MKTHLTFLFLGMSIAAYSQDQKENNLLEAIKSDSTNGANYSALADYYYYNFKKDKYDQVHPLLLKANKLSNNAYYPRAMYNNTEALFKSLERYSETAPSELVFQWLGDVYFYKGRSQEAIVAYQKLLKYRTEDYVTLYNIGNSFESLKNSDSAYFYYYKSGKTANTKQIKEYQDKRDQAWYKLFLMAKEKNNDELFIEAYDNMVIIDPNNFPGYEDEQYYSLIKELKTKQTAETYVKFGDFHNNGKRYAAAITAYEKSIQLNPTTKAAIVKKIIKSIKDDAYYTYFDKREYEKSLARYEDALKYTTSDPEIYSALATICMDKLTPSDYKKAIQYYQKSLTLTTSPMEKKDILENIGLCYEQQKDYANAIVYYDKAVAQAPNFAKTAHYKLARVYEAKGDAANTLKHRKLSH